MRTRQTKNSGNNYWSDIIYHTKDIVATNLSASETYIQNTPLNLTDIVICNSFFITATITLSTPSAGSLNTATSGDVTSTYSTGVWSASGALADVNALLAGLIFTSGVSYHSNFTITTSVSDGTLTLTGTKNMTGIAVNSAPVLDASKSPTLTSIAQDSGAQDSGAPVGVVGTQVTNLIDNVVPAGGLDNVTDADGDTIGIAIVAVDTTHGSWFYTINSGTTWTAMGSVSTSSARLLSPSARIYFQPTASYSGTVSSAITFRAWDQTSGTNGSTASTTSSGGSTAFSTATDTASITVT